MTSVWSGAPELPSLIRITCCLYISGAPDTRVPKEFGIFTESSMMTNLQSIAQENRCLLLDPPGTDPVQYVSNHPWIERLPKRYRVDVSYPETRLTNFRLIGIIQPSISSHRNEVQAHLKSTLLWRVMVSDLTSYVNSIRRPTTTCFYPSITYDPTLGYDPTPGMPLDHVYPLRITLERFI